MTTTLQVNEYHSGAMETALYGSSVADLTLDLNHAELADLMKLVYAVTGLAGEGGELANKLKKVIRDDGGRLTEERRSQMRKELGGVLWYAAATATELGINLSDVCQENLDILQSRQERNVIHGDGDDR